MSEEFPWKKGRTYKTKGGLHATITEVRSRAVPKEMSLADLERLMKNPHFGIEGFAFLPSNPKQRHRGEWTMGGLHSLDPSSSGSGDLTTEEVTDESN